MTYLTILGQYLIKLSRSAVGCIYVAVLLWLCHDSRKIEWFSIFDSLILAGQSCTAPRVTAYPGPCPQTKYTEGFNQQSASGLYTYDNGGNLSYDPNKKLTFYYNYHNLPYRIVGAENDELQILYGADGSLLQRKYLK